MLAAGDGTATMVGRRAPIRPLPWNPDKSLGGMLAFMILGAFERDDDAVIITDELVREQLNVPGMLNHRLLQYLNEYENLATDDEKACMSSMKRELERSRTRM